MSRAYRVAVSESITEVIHVEDGIQSRLELLDILPKDELGEILARELEKNGFEREGNTMKRVEEDGVEIVVSLEDGTVTVKTTGEAQVEKTIEGERWVGQGQEQAAERALRQGVEKALERHVEEEKVKLGEQLAEKLEGKLKDLKKELDQVSNKVTAEALKVKAGRLGEIQEVQENAETGAITIKVKV